MQHPCLDQCPCRKWRSSVSSASAYFVSCCSNPRWIYISSVSFLQQMSNPSHGSGSSVVSPIASALAFPSSRGLRHTGGGSAAFPACTGEHPTSPASPHTTISSSWLVCRGRLALLWSLQFLHLLCYICGGFFFSCCSFAWAAVGKEAATRAAGGLQCAG